MTIREQIEALPWYQRTIIDQQVAQWVADRNLTAYLQGNAAKLAGLIADVQERDWSMYEAEPVQDEIDQSEAPQTPAEETAPVEEGSAGPVATNE